MCRHGRISNSQTFQEHSKKYDQLSPSRIFKPHNPLLEDKKRRTLQCHMKNFLPVLGLVLGAPVPGGLAILLGALIPVGLAVLIFPTAIWPTRLVSVRGHRLIPDHENKRLQVSVTAKLFSLHKGKGGKKKKRRKTRRREKTAPHKSNPVERHRNNITSLHLSWYIFQNAHTVHVNNGPRNKWLKLKRSNRKLSLKF